jgi:hypothetical protein
MTNTGESAPTTMNPPNEDQCRRTPPNDDHRRIPLNNGDWMTTTWMTSEMTRMMGGRGETSRKRTGNARRRRRGEMIRRRGQTSRRRSRGEMSRRRTGEMVRRRSETTRSPGETTRSLGETTRRRRRKGGGTMQRGGNEEEGDAEESSRAGWLCSCYLFLFLNYIVCMYTQTQGRLVFLGKIYLLYYNMCMMSV